MKLAAKIAWKAVSDNLDRTNKLVHLIAGATGNIRVDPPKMASQIACPFCGCKEYFLIMENQNERLWLCRDICEGSRISHSKAPRIDHHLKTGFQSSEPKRAILWASYCEKMAIGNMHHDVVYENVKLSAGKMEFLEKFIAKPSGILFMQGDPGTGKTYTCLGICEYFTRENSSCFFGTQRQILKRWLDTFKDDNVNDFIDKITNCSLLVIDDFGTAEISSGFMSFLMDVINTRMQWNNRGTIITTNLADDKFSEYCGQALMDRIRTGQKFEFKGASKRRPRTL